MFDLGGAILSFVESVTTSPKIQTPKAKLTAPELAYKIAFCFVAAWAIQFLLTGMFNLANHPLADFPGPRLAAFTEWYKTYREFFCGESWVHVLEEMHKKYGMLKYPNVRTWINSRKGK